MNIKQIDEICSKYNFINKTYIGSYFTCWMKYDYTVVSYDHFYEKLSVATMVIQQKNDKFNFCFFEQITIEDLEKSIENVLKQYKKALIMKKMNEISKDFI